MSVSTFRCSAFIMGWVPETVVIAHVSQAFGACLEFSDAYFYVANYNDYFRDCGGLSDERFLYAPFGCLEICSVQTPCVFYFNHTIISLEDCTALVAGAVVRCIDSNISSDGISVVDVESFHVGSVPSIFTKKYLVSPLFGLAKGRNNI